MAYKEAPEEPEDFGFNYPEEYLFRVCPIVIASNYVSLPEDGGLNAQDPLFIDDLDTYLRLKQWAVAEVKGIPKSEGGESKGLEFDEL